MFAECLLNVDQIFSGFFQNAATFRSFHGAFTEPSRSLHGAFTPHSGPFRTGTSSAGVCIWPVGPLLVSSSARPAAALRDFFALYGRHNNSWSSTSYLRISPPIYVHPDRNICAHGPTPEYLINDASKLTNWEKSIHGGQNIANG